MITIMYTCIHAGSSIDNLIFVRGPKRLLSISRSAHTHTHIHTIHSPRWKKKSRSAAALHHSLSFHILMNPADGRVSFRYTRHSYATCCARTILTPEVRSHAWLTVLTRSTSSGLRGGRRYRFYPFIYLVFFFFRTSIIIIIILSSSLRRVFGVQLVFTGCENREPCQHNPFASTRLRARTGQ